MTPAGESLVKTRSLEDLVSETNSLLRQLVRGLEMIYEIEIPAE